MLTQDLLDANLLKRLEGYRLVRQTPVYGRPGGARRSLQKGGAVEFADYREYAPGDELRRVDWKAYARLGRLYVKEFLDERQQTVLFLLDVSASMDWGGPPAHKGRYALQIAAGLGTCALAGSDRLAVIFAGGEGKVKEETAGNGKAGWRISPEFKSRTALPGFWNFLRSANFSGSAGLASSLHNVLKLVRGAKSLYVFSDLYDLPDVQEMLRLAAGRGLAVTLLHILSPEERAPEGEGEYLLIDPESGARIEITLNPAAYLAYTRRLEMFFRELDSSCRRWGGKRVLLDSGEAAADTLFKTLPRAGVLQPRG
ncbi:MAG: DUF58 domain-containing protein [Armatimonadetes bacterium]|nr:DUF58 domain-containing protein [Armatimonadota bacterium]